MLTVLETDFLEQLQDYYLSPAVCPDSKQGRDGSLKDTQQLGVRSFAGIVLIHVFLMLVVSPLLHLYDSKQQEKAKAKQREDNSSAANARQREHAQQALGESRSESQHEQPVPWTGVEAVVAGIAE